MIATDADLDVTQPLKIGNESARNEYEVVHLLMKVLAGTCDGARTLDGQGFNRFHASFGHQIAEMPFEALTDRQLWASRKILTTYKNTQLAPFWHLVPEIPEPPKPGEEISRDSSYAEWKRKQNPSWQPFSGAKRMVIEAVNGRDHFAFYSPYNATLKDAIKRLGGARWVWEDRQAEIGHWLVPVTHDTMEGAAALALDFALDVPDAVVQTISATIDEYKERIELSSKAELEGIVIDLPDGLKLYPFQEVGVEYIKRTPNVLLADQMGLGKTPQSLIGMNHVEGYPCLVICPASLKDNWKKEVQRWLPGKKVVVLSGKMVARLRWAQDNSTAYDVAIINYDVLGKWLDNLIDFLGGREIHDEASTAANPRQLPYDNRRDGKPHYGTIIIDECHALKNPDAQRTKNISKLLKACHYSRRIFLSGTPVVNRPVEFWSMIKLLGYEQQFGGWGRYNATYNVKWRPALEELNTKARSLFMVRRAKKDVLTELPPKQYTIIPLEIDNRAEYSKAERDIAHFFAQKKAETANYEDVEFAAMLQAKQMKLKGAEATAFIDAQMAGVARGVYAHAYDMASKNEQLLRWEALKQLAVKGKMRAVVEWLDEFMESGEKIVVFATHTQVIEDLAHRYRAPYIHGGVAAERRQALVDRFQNDPNCRMIVGNIKAMGEGLTLHAASDVAFVEFGWSPKDHDQAEDRCHRIGQKDSVMVWNLAADYTIDYEIAALIEEKRMVVDSITDGGEFVTQQDMMSQLETRLMSRLSSRKG